MKYTDELGKLLKETLALARKTREEELSQKEIGRKAAELEEIRKKMLELFNSEVTKDKLLDAAKNGLREYPLLLVSTEYRPTKNKVSGYKYNMAKDGEILFDILVQNGFTPEIIEIQDYDITRIKSRKLKLNEKVVYKKGFYLGIKWNK